jgi:CHASE1-domain containing sensor protein
MWRARHVRLSIAAALIGLAVSATGWLVIFQREDQLAILELNARADDHGLVLQNGIDAYLSRVVSLRALFDADDLVGREEFGKFAQEILQGQTAMLAVSWIPRIPRAERADHEMAAAREGLAGYQIKSVAPDGRLIPSADRSEYFPVFYSTDLDQSSPVYGLDLNDGGLRQQTLERARDGNRMATSRNFMLRSGVGDRNGFFVLMPVYRPGLSHDTVQNRRDNLIGFVQGVFQSAVMIETILAAATVPTGLDVYFFTPESGPDASPLFFHGSRKRATPIQAQPLSAITAGLHWSSEIQVGDAAWTLVVAPIPGGPGIAGHAGSWLMLAGLLLVSAIVVAYIWASGLHTKRLQDGNERLDQALSALGSANNQLVTQNVRFDTALNNMMQGLLMFDSEERIVVCNDRYIEMYELSREIVRPGCTLRELFRHRVETGHLKRDPEEYRAQLIAEIAQGKPVSFIVETADGARNVDHEQAHERRRVGGYP